MKHATTKQPVSDVRITEPYLLRQIAAEQDRQGDGTATKTASRLILERLRELDIERRNPSPGEHSNHPANAV